MSDLDKLKEIFLTDVDEETKAENLEQIRQWEQTLIRSEAFKSWQEHDVTRQIAGKAKETYKDAVLSLGRDRWLKDTQRAELFAKQDAALWILSLTEQDIKVTIEQVQKEIRTALNAV